MRSDLLREIRLRVGWVWRDHSVSSASVKIGICMVGDDGVGAKPVRDFTDGVAVGVVEMVAGSKDFDRFGTGVMKGVEMAWVEAIGEEDVG